MRTPRSLLSFIAYVFLPLASVFAAEPGQRWAVLVEVNDYIELDDLRFCRKDAQSLARRLTEVGFPEENVVLVTDGASAPRNQPLKANIEAKIRSVLAVAEPGDLVLVSFSGHGMHLDGKTYLCPTDARVDSPESTMIPLATIYGNLERSKASRKLLWVDACRNDPRPAGSRSATSHAESVKGMMESLKTPPEGTLTLASCAAEQISWEDDSFGHGVFKHYLLEGLSGNADQQERGNRDDRISLMELYNYANIKTRRYVLASRHRAQTPELFGRITGDFGIAEMAKLPGELTNSIGMKLKLIPAGEFMTGSGESAESLVKGFENYGKPEANLFSDEYPQHRVRITKPFYLGAHEVTLGQFLQFYHDAGYKTEAERDGKGGWGYTGDTENSSFVQKPQFAAWETGFPQTNDRPVVNVSWNDAVAFCEWLSRKEGATYRLPTEAEWEYACRAGTTARYYSGDDPEGLARVGNVADGTAKEKFSEWTAITAKDGYVFSAPVGQFPPNLFGLYDMHGNVWEWCQDWYDSSYYGVSALEDPKGPDSGRVRVIRGGGWISYAGFCRSAYRGGHAPAGRSPDLGFRVARVPAE